MNRKVEISVGLFMVIVICSVLFLCFRVTDATTFTSNSTYRVYAVFDNIGGLKARSPIKIGGVVVGRVADISLLPYKSDDSDSYKPYVTMDINADYANIPSSSSLSIKTSGLLGEQFIDIGLGIDNSTVNDIDSLDAEESGMISGDDATNTLPYFQAGFVVHNTKPTVVLEDIIGQLMYSLAPSKESKHSVDTTSSTDSSADNTEEERLNILNVESKEY